MNLRLKFLFLSVLFIVQHQVNAQTKAVTENGDTIYVYDNGTWSFEMLDEMPNEADNALSFLSTELDLDTIASNFTAPSKAKKEVKNAEGMFVIKYDDALWKRVPPATLNDEAEFAFQSKKTDIWCVIISEQTPIAADKLFLIAKNNMKEFTGADPKVIKTESRTVNGQQVVRGVMQTQISGIDIIFDTYYYSNDLGSVQFSTWTGERVWERNKEDILDLLNGFIVN